MENLHLLSTYDDAGVGGDVSGGVGGDAIVVGIDGDVVIVAGIDGVGVGVGGDGGVGFGGGGGDGMVWQLTFIRCLLCVRHGTKSFTNITSCSSNNNPMRQHSFYPNFSK